MQAYFVEMKIIGKQERKKAIATKIDSLVK